MKLKNILLIIKINNMENKTVINTKTQEEYNELMKIFEKKGWFWYGWGEQPTYISVWDKFEKNTCIEYKNNFAYTGVDTCKEKRYTIISFQEFL